MATIKEEAPEAVNLPQEKVPEEATSPKAEAPEVEVLFNDTTIQNLQEEKNKENPEDRCMVFLVMENIKRMMLVHSLNNLRTLAKKRFPGNEAATLFFQDTLLDPLITLKDII